MHGTTNLQKFKQFLLLLPIALRPFQFGFGFDSSFYYLLIWIPKLNYYATSSTSSVSMSCIQLLWTTLKRASISPFSLKCRRTFFSKIRTYLLIPRSRVLLEKLTDLQLVKKFATFYGTRRFITAFTTACYLSLSWASSIQSIPPHPEDSCTIGTAF
jgi:hypothetical protein